MCKNLKYYGAKRKSKSKSNFQSCIPWYNKITRHIFDFVCWWNFSFNESLLKVLSIEIAWDVNFKERLSQLRPTASQWNWFLLQHYKRILSRKSLFFSSSFSLSHSRFQLNRDCWMERAFSFDFPKVHGAKIGRRKLSLKESRRTKCCFGCKCIFHFWQKYQYKVFTNIEKHFQIELKYRYIYIDDFV